MRSSKEGVFEGAPGLASAAILSLCSGENVGYGECYLSRKESVQRRKSITELDGKGLSAKEIVIADRLSGS